MRSARLNTIARLAGAKRYLEIGVCEGETFFQVDVKSKVAVDPNFQFDFKAKETNEVRFYPVPSDDFFRDVRCEPFDLIYLDGLHTFDQTLRDFMNSLAVSHSRTVWVFDDTMPNDNFSALADQDRCYKLRRILGNGDWAWMGDVYKVVYFIRSALKYYQLRTFTAHGQTVVWRDLAQFEQGPSLNIDEIGLMTYEDYVETYQEVFNIASDDAIYADLAAFFSVTG